MNVGRSLRWIGIGLIVVAAILLIIALMQGDFSFALLLFIPVIVGEGVIAVLGGVLLFFGLLLLFLSFVTGCPVVDETGGQGWNTEQEGEKRWGGFILIGPIPIVLGSDTRTTLVLAIMAIATLVAITIFLLIR
jgi:uncharacterized protein (TIGR00304 family)